MKYILYDATGQIYQAVMAPEEDAKALAKSLGLSMIEQTSNENLEYAVVVNGKVIDLGPPPGKYYVIQNGVWVDTSTLDQLKGDKWKDIKRIRSLYENAPITVTGNTFDANPPSQAKISAAAQLALLQGSEYMVEWTLADNSTVILTAPQIISVNVALGARTSAIYATARSIRNQIDNAATKEALMAIQWPESSTI